MKIIVFKQNNCRPCDTLAMVMEHDLEVVPDRVVNLSQPKDDDLQLASKYGVMATPVLVLTDDEGNVVRDIRGIAMRSDVEALFLQRG